MLNPVTSETEKATRFKTQGWEALQDNPALPVLLKYKDTVFKEELELTNISTKTAIEHEIELTTDEPFNIPQFQLSPDQQRAVGEWTEKMLAAGMIRKSTSPFNSPIFCVKKPVGWRIVHDFRSVMWWCYVDLGCRILACLLKVFWCPGCGYDGQCGFGFPECADVCCWRLGPGGPCSWHYSCGECSCGGVLALRTLPVYCFFARAAKFYHQLGHSEFDSWLWVDDFVSVEPSMGTRLVESEHRLRSSFHLVFGSTSPLASIGISIRALSPGTTWHERSFHGPSFTVHIGVHVAFVSRFPLPCGDLHFCCPGVFPSAHPD